MSAACQICHAPDAEGGFCDMCELNDPGRVAALEAGRLTVVRAEVERTIAQWTKDAASLDAYASAGDDTRGLGWACRHDAAAERRRAADLFRWLEAGRLAAIRDEVRWAMRDMEDEAHSRSERHPDDAAASHAERAAWERLADCCRWLEVTR